MTSTQLRRLTSQKPDENVRVTNTLVDMLKGNQTGRIYLNGDGGLEKALQGGATLASLVPALMIRPDSGEQMWLKHSNDTDTVLRAQDSGVTIETLDVTGNVTITGTLDVTGLTTLAELTVTDAATFADTLDVTGAATFADTLDVGSGVLLVDPAAPMVTVAAPLVVNESGDPVSSSGHIRASSPFQIRARNAGDSLDIEIISTNGDDVAVGGTNARDLYIQCNNEMSHYIGGSLIIHTDSTGIGFNGTSATPPPTLSGSAAAAYDATTRQLINDIRDCLQDNGLAN